MPLGCVGPTHFLESGRQAVDVLIELSCVLLIYNSRRK